jgi:hypothetical protein
VTPKKQAASSRANNTKGSAAKKKQSIKETSSSSASDSDEDEKPMVDRKRKPVKGTKGSVKKTPNKSAVIDSSDNSESESSAGESCSRGGKKAAPKSSKESEKSVAKTAESSSCASITKDLQTKPQSQTPVKVDSKSGVKGKEDKDNKDNKLKAGKKEPAVARTVKSEPKPESGSSSSSKVKKTPAQQQQPAAQVSNKTAQESVVKSAENVSKVDSTVDEKSAEVPASEVTKGKLVSDKTQTSQTSKTASVSSEVDVKGACETPTKSSSEQQKLTNKKKTTDSSSKPPAKRCKVESPKRNAESPRTTVRHPCENEREDSLVSRTDNIFEKMEKQENVDKIDRELEKLHAEPVAEVKTAASNSVADAASRPVASVKSEMPVFVPADEEKIEPAVEAVTKLTVERLKEESAKEETIEEAVKAIMELTKETETPAAAVAVAEETTPKRQHIDMDSSVSVAEEVNDALETIDASQSDDAGELNAAIESLIEKELEPTDDSSLLPLQPDKSPEADMAVDDGDMRQDVAVEEECATNYKIIDKELDETELVIEQKEQNASSSNGEHGKEADAHSAVIDAAVKSELESTIWNVRNQQPNDANVTSFMTRLSKATADIVTDFAALRKPMDESAPPKSGDLNVMGAKLDQPGRLFSNLYQPKSEVEWVNGSVAGSFLVKREIESEVERPVDIEQQQGKESVVTQSQEYVTPEIEKEKPADILATQEEVASEEKTTMEVDTRVQPSIIRKQERSDLAASAPSDDAIASADLYEFKDDEEEMKHPLHKRPRKRPGDSDSSETGGCETTPEPKKSRKRANSANAKIDVQSAAVEAKVSAVSAIIETALPATTMTAATSEGSADETCRPATSVAMVGATEAVVATCASDNDSWQAHMDSVIDAVARGNFQRGDESDYYTMASSAGPGTTRRTRGRRPQVQKAAAAAAIQTTSAVSHAVVTPPTVGQLTMTSATFVSAHQTSTSTVAPSSFVLTSIGTSAIQRSLGTSTPSGKASPKVVACLAPTMLHSPQLVVSQRMYTPGTYWLTLFTGSRWPSCRASCLVNRVPADNAFSQPRQSLCRALTSVKMKSNFKTSYVMNSLLLLLLLPTVILNNSCTWFACVF